MNSHFEKISNNICPVCGDQGTMVSEMVGLAYFRWSPKENSFKCYCFDKDDFNQTGDIFCSNCGTHFNKEGFVIER